MLISPKFGGRGAPGVAVVTIGLSLTVFVVALNLILEYPFLMKEYT